MRFRIAVLCLLGINSAMGQNYVAFKKIIHKFYTASSVGDVDKAWDSLSRVGQIPLVVEDSVAFLYRGEANSVRWMGDFNGWGYIKTFKNEGTRIPNTDIWILKASFPKDARLDYKVVVDNTNYLIDPYNHHQQWSGVGGGSPNSELRMPLWKEDPLCRTRIGEAKPGRMETDLLINSKVLNYQVTYSVYTPPDYKPENQYPIVYATDGYEYMHEKMGNIGVVLDNLIALKKIKPVVVVLIDHREPVNRSNNRRMNELALNQKYLEFVSRELVPVIHAHYSISADPSQHAILGTSMGGLTAAYFAFSKPDVFGLAGIQSPAFWFKPEIYTLCDNPEKPPVKIFLSTGLINDAEEGSRKMKEILEKNTCNYQYVQTNQGHSWGNWKDTIDDILIYFFPY